MAAPTSGDRVRAFVERLWNRHDAAALAEFVHEDLREEIRAHHEQLVQAFPDVAVVIDEMVAEGDKVAARLTISGTHEGAFAGVAATGRRVSYGSFRFYTLRDGRIVETHAMQDRLGLLQQLGASGAEGVNWAAGGAPSTAGRR